MCKRRCWGLVAVEARVRFVRTNAVLWCMRSSGTILVLERSKFMYLCQVVTMQRATESL